MSRNKVRAVLAAMLAACAVGFAFGDVFYCKDLSSDRTVGFSDPTVWGVGSIDDPNVDQRYPGENDWIYYGEANPVVYFNFDLGGDSHKVKGLSLVGYKEGWNYHYWRLANGTLEFTTGFTNLYARVTCYAGSKFVIGDQCGSQLGGSGAYTQITVEGNAEGYLGGYVTLRMIKVTNKANGVFTLKPNGDVVLPTSLYEASFFSNSGSFVIPSGVRFSGAGSSSGSIEFRQQAGTMTLGGDLVKDATAKSTPVCFILSGGVLQATDDAAIKGFDSVTMAADSTATVSVDTGKTLGLSSMAFAPGTTLGKTGAGTLELGAEAPATLLLDAGGVRLTRAVSLGAVALGGVLTIATPEVSVDAMTGLSEGLVVVDTTDIPNGARVLISEDDDLLDQVLKCATVVGDGTLAKVGNALMLTKVDAESNVFTADGEADFSDATAWSKGAPTEGSKLVISGSGTTCVLKKADLGMTFASITVVAGATLKVAEALTLQPITLLYESRLLFAKGGSTLPVGTILATASADAMPVVEVEKGASLNPARGFVFKNVFLKLRGNVTSADGPLTFGSADALETAYFSMLADGVTIDLAGSNSHNDHEVRWVTPAVGGKVVVPEGITLKDCTVTSTWNQNYIFQIGLNNPRSEAFDFTMDGTKIMLRAAGTCTVDGGAKIHAKNAGGFFSDAVKRAAIGWGYLKAYGNSTFLFEGENSGVCHYFTRNGTEYLAATDGTEQMTFRDGAAWQVANGGQSGKTSVFVFENGYWDLIDKPFYDAGYWKTVPESEVQNYMTEIFAGLKSVRVVSGSSVGLRSYRGVDEESMQWNRSKTIANVPVTGENGSLFVTNCTPGYSMEAVMTCGRNTATGEAWAETCADGARLTFADGSNWAGIVRGAEGIGFTNLTAAASPAHVTFGGLRFTGKMPIRVWKGAVTTNDTIEIVSSLTAGARKQGFAPVLMTGGTFGGGDVLTVGTCPKSAVPEDCARAFSGDRRWRLETAAIDGDETRVELKLVYDPIGLAVVVR